ncbi:MAG: hypothetical protein V1695_02150 [Candidatus Uhrbacteria bacterium]
MNMQPECYTIEFCDMDRGKVCFRNNEMDLTDVEPAIGQIMEQIWNQVTLVGVTNLANETYQQPVRIPKEYWVVTFIDELARRFIDLEPVL